MAFLRGIWIAVNIGFKTYKVSTYHFIYLHVKKPFYFPVVILFLK